MQVRRKVCLWATSLGALNEIANKIATVGAIKIELILGLMGWSPLRVCHRRTLISEAGRTVAIE